MVRESHSEISNLNDVEKRAVTELGPHIEKLLNDIHEDIEKENFSAIVVDDRSGRIPGLIVGEVLWNLYQEKGKTAPEIHFMQGAAPMREAGMYDMEKKLADLGAYLGRVHKRLQGLPGGVRRFLYVTEFVETGGNIVLPLRALEHEKITWPMTAISVGIDSKKVDIAQETIRQAGGLNTPFFYSLVGSPRIMQATELAGIVKTKHQDIHATPMVTWLQERGMPEHAERAKGKILGGYQVASKVAKQILKNYRKKYRSGR